MIRWQLRDGIATLTLDRGGARNAIPVSGWDALATAAAEIAGTDARAVILASAQDRAFSAGADLAAFRDLVDQPGSRPGFRMAMRAGIDAVAALPMPVIAAVDGGCFGAAVALALACDIIIAGDGAIFATTPAKLGLSYPAQDVARLTARVGRAEAAMMLFGGAPVDADAAFRIGLAQRRAARAKDEAAAVAATIAANVPGAVRALKQVVKDPAGRDHDAVFDDMFGSPAFAERLGAFLDGRR